MTRVGTAALVAAMVAIAAPARAQSTPWLVSVEWSGEDAIGQRLASAVREQFRGSQGFMLVANDDTNVRIAVVLVTLDPDARERGLQTVGSVTYVLHSQHEKHPPMYLTSKVVLSGMDRVESTARGIVATLDEELSR